MERLLFIFNPHSGKGLIKNSLVEIVDTFVREDYEVTIYTTQAPKDATDKVIDSIENYDRIVCSGGDGTLDEVITGVMKSNRRVPVGYIPAGSTNDFGSSLGIDKEMERSANIAAKGDLFPCDIGKFQDDYFVYVAAFGIFTETSYATPQRLKNALGHAAYILEGIKQVNNVPSYHLKIEYDEGVIEDDFIYGMVTNSLSVGGFTGIIKGEVGLSDGVFEGCFVKTPNNPLELNDILAYLTGLKKNSDHVYTFQSSHFKISCEEELPWTLDGEYGGDHSEVEIKNCHEAIDILVEE